MAWMSKGRIMWILFIHVLLVSCLGGRFVQNGRCRLGGTTLPQKEGGGL